MPVPLWRGAKGLCHLVSEMHNCNLHPSLPVPGFWLEEEAVIASTAPRRCVVTHWVRARGTGHLLYPGTPRAL